DGTISHGAQPRHGTPREGQGRPSARRRFLTFRITARLSGGHVLNQITPEAVSLTVERNVLVATIDNPPVNALSHSVRAGLVAAVDRLEGDSDLVALVISSRAKHFCSGADVKEFGKPMVAPLLGEVIKRLDASNKPIVAAIQGAALGGGLEVALACNIRVAAPSAKMGLPEVKLGILPGSGGILRLPRLIGIEAALSLVTEGKQIGAAQRSEEHTSEL